MTSLSAEVGAPGDNSWRLKAHGVILDAPSREGRAKLSKRSVARTGRTAAPAAADASRDPFELAVRALFWLGLVAGSLVFLPKLFYDGFEAPKLFAAEVTVTLAAGLWLLRAARRGELRLRLPRIALPLAALGLVALLSILWSHNRGLALERLQHLATLIAFLPLAWGLYRRREIRRPLYLILLLGAGIAAWGWPSTWRSRCAGRSIPAISIFSPAPPAGPTSTGG